MANTVALTPPQSRQDIQVSLACWPAAHHIDALLACARPDGSSPLHEPLWGALNARQVQMVPQSRGMLDEALVRSIQQQYPNTQFRLHANARVQVVHRIIDLADLHVHPQADPWFKDAARVSQWLGAPAYSVHSGLRERASLNQMLDNARELADWFACPVAVEGQYPTADGNLLINSWEEYRILFESGVPYALDLSHLNILAHHSGRREDALVSEMLSCERCLEVHVSHNDGSRDQHRTCNLPLSRFGLGRAHALWWLPLLSHTHPNAVVFSEGNHRHVRRQSLPQDRSDQASVKRESSGKLHGSRV